MTAFEQLTKSGRISEETARNLVDKYQQKIDENTVYIKEQGIDLPEIDAWQWIR
jgi:phosphoketolase